MISVIVPTLNEAARLPSLLASLLAQDRPCEIIVADGGSDDGTQGLAEQSGAKVVQSARGRGQQIRQGVTRAQGDVLLFLHADCILPHGALRCIEDELMRSPDLLGGNFRLLFDGNDGFSRWLTGFYAWIRARGIYYGDSGVFVRCHVYEEIGGLRPIALMEDYDFNRRMERAGRTCCISDPPIITSARRFAGRRPLAIVAGWIWIHALFHLGVPPSFLARLYRSDRHAKYPSNTQAGANP